jgi:deoxyribose-phosphate aldolase
MTAQEREEAKEAIRDQLEALQYYAEELDLVIEFNTLSTDKKYHTLEIRDRTTQ